MNRRRPTKLESDQARKIRILECEIAHMTDEIEFSSMCKISTVDSQPMAATAIWAARRLGHAVVAITNGSNIEFYARRNAR